MSSLNELLGTATQQESGTGVTESGSVVIGSTTAGQPTEIQTSSGETVVKVTDDGGFQLSDSQVVRQIVNAINTGDDDNDMKLPTVQAVMTFLAGAVTATIDFAEFTSKGDFDSFIANGGFIPTIAFVTDTTPFDYTDDTGHAGTDLTWMFVVCVEENGVITTSMINNSDISNLTGDEIASIIAATEDVNFVNDSDLSRIRNLPDSTVDALGGKVNTEIGKGLSQNNFTDSQRSKVDNLPSNTNIALAGKANTSGQVFAGIVQAKSLGTTTANEEQAIVIGNGGVDDAGNSGLAWRVGTSTDARDGNYRAQIRMNYEVSKFEFRVGNSISANNLITAVSIDRFGQVSVNGSPVLTELTGLMTTTDSEIVDASLTISNPGTGKGYLEFSNTSSAADRKFYRMLATAQGTLRIDTVDDSGVVVNSYELGHDGNVTLPGNVEVGGYISMFDSGGHEHRFEHGSDGIGLRALTNPSAGESIFTVSSSGDSKRLNVEHDGAITTSNSEMRIGTEPDGTGGDVVLTAGNLGRLRASRTYIDGFPTLTAAEIAQWWTQSANVNFVSVGAGTITLPQIVSSNPTANQVLAGDSIFITNWNSGSDITFNRFNTYQTVMVDNVGDLGNSFTLFSGTKVELVAMDLRGLSSVGKWTWAVRGV